MDEKGGRETNRTFASSSSLQLRLMGCLSAFMVPLFHINRAWYGTDGFTSSGSNLPSDMRTLYACKIDRRDFEVEDQSTLVTDFSLGC